MKLNFKTEIFFEKGGLYVEWELKGKFKPFYTHLIKQEINQYFYRKTTLNTYETTFISSRIKGNFIVGIDSNNKDIIEEKLGSILDNIKNIIKYNLITLPRKMIMVKKSTQGATTLVVPVTEFLKALS